MESLGSASHGCEGLTTRDVIRMRQWARRWSSLTPELREYYRSALGLLSFFEDHQGARRLQQQALSMALWRIFEGYSMPGWAHGCMRELWSELQGPPPMFDLVPRCGRRLRAKI